MKPRIPYLLATIMLALASAIPLSAQEDIVLLRPEEKELIDKQASELNKAIAPALSRASQSTVRIWERGQAQVGSYLAYGTVVGDGCQVLSKWSELRSDQPRSLLLQAADGRAIPARMVKVYPDQDLALLEFEGEPLKPVQWADELPVLGSFMAATQPNGQLAGFGVLSVKERSLRDSDKAFLGVVGDMGFEGPGVLVRQVSEDSGAAKAGIEAGDIILKVGERKISGLMELRNALLPIEPGRKVTLKIKREDEINDVPVELGSRPEFPNMLGSRLRQMEQMGTKISNVRDSFTNVLQTDMSLEPNQIGGPVVNLKGKVVGVSLARADRTRSFVMSAPAVRELLNKEGRDPQVAMADLQARIREAQAALPRMRPQKPKRLPSPDQLEGHLEQMRRLLGLLEREMEALER